MADLGNALQSVLQVPGLQELLNQSITRQRQLAPLRTATTQQAMNMLPNSAFAGPQTDAAGRAYINTVQPANYSTPAPQDSGADWPKILGMIGGGVGIAGLLARLLGGGGKNGGSGGPGSPGSGGGGNLANLANLFRHHGDTNIFGGNTSYTGRPGSPDPFGGADNPYYYGNLPGYGAPPGTNPYENLPGYGTPLPGLPPDYSNLPGYGTPLPPAGGSDTFGDDTGSDYWDE